MAKVRCEVNHPNLFLAVSTELERQQLNSIIHVEEAHVDRYIKNGSLRVIDTGSKVGRPPKNAEKEEAENETEG